MNCPELYIKANNLQRSDVQEIVDSYVKQMSWKSNEVVLDIGCGPGDITSDILFCSLQNKIKKLVGVDKSEQMIEYAKSTYECSKIDFKVLDIENSNDCTFYSRRFSKIFSFYCLHWISNKYNALVNMHSMLKNGGDILVRFILINPIHELYKSMDTEWQKYIDNVKQRIKTILYTQEDVKAIFIKAGFRIINIESSVKKYTFPDISTLLNAVKAVDDMYNVLPPNLHDKYFTHVKNKILEIKAAEVCPLTGKTTRKYLPITIHAIKD